VLATNPLRQNHFRAKFKLECLLETCKRRAHGHDSGYAFVQRQPVWPHRVGRKVERRSSCASSGLLDT